MRSLVTSQEHPEDSRTRRPDRDVPGSRKKAAGATLAWGRANSHHTVGECWEQDTGRVRCRERCRARGREDTATGHLHSGTGRLRPGGSEGGGSNGHAGSQRRSRGAGPRGWGGRTHPALPAGADWWRDARQRAGSSGQKGQQARRHAGAEGRVQGRSVNRAEHSRTAGAQGLESLHWTRWFGGH